ncbi:MAG: cobamide remodeling phosphodiesterase CbiR, partial [Synergistaceae bacterium]|nr:cobamide remodeling phosphodiesterase CbiR [Synergistaceae bacterium]
MIRRSLEGDGLRLGGTSWVVPRTFADNLRYLSNDVSDMEIVLFDTPEHSNVPSKEEIRLLRDLCSELDMSCTVHFPAEICVSCSTLERQKREDLCLRTVELFAPLDPFAWILHVVGEKRGNFPSAEMGSWLEKSIKSAGMIAGAVDDSRKICIETLDYDPRYVEHLADFAGTSICLDVGHLIKCGRPVLETAGNLADDVRVLHIHGVMSDGTDHRDLSYMDPELFRSVVEMMSG